MKGPGGVSIIVHGGRAAEPPYWDKIRQMPYPNPREFTKAANTVLVTLIEPKPAKKKKN